MGVGSTSPLAVSPVWAQPGFLGPVVPRPRPLDSSSMTHSFTEEFIYLFIYLSSPKDMLIDFKGGDKEGERG